MHHTKQKPSYIEHKTGHKKLTFSLRVLNFKYIQVVTFFSYPGKYLTGEKALAFPYRSYPLHSDYWDFYGRHSVAPRFHLEICSRWGTADEIKVTSDSSSQQRAQNYKTGLSGARSRSEYNFICFTYCQEYSLSGFCFSGFFCLVGWLVGWWGFFFFKFSSNTYDMCHHSD